MNISLPESMKAWVESRVGSGLYANASDYMRDLIRHDLENHWDADDLEALPEILEGIADIKAGRTTPGKQVFAELRAQILANAPK